MLASQGMRLSISIKKIWDDDGDAEHPDYITVQVYQDGVPGAESIAPQLLKNGEPYGHIMAVL